MTFDLTEDQTLLADTTAKYLAANCSLQDVRRLEHAAAGFDHEYWVEGAALGWTSMLVAEEHGGGSVSGSGIRDLVLIAEEMGRLVAPGPLVPTNIVAGTISTAGSAEQREGLLPGLLGGDLVAAWAFAEPGATWDAAGVRLNATYRDGEFVLDGVKTTVEAGAEADILLVTARSGDGLTQFLVPSDHPGVTARQTNGLDLVRRFADMHFADVRVPAEAVIGEAGAAAHDVERQLQHAIVLQCAESVGAATRVFEFTLEYVADRYSFGRPLASYQALKHRFADSKLWLETSAAAVAAAAEAIDSKTDDDVELVSVAKAYVGDHIPEIIQDCVQMHGGIGVTWEHDLHLYLRRVTINRSIYGSPIQHRERLAALLGM